MFEGKWNRRVCADVEALEKRMMLSGSISINNGLVTVIGTTDSDTIAGGINPGDSSQYYFLVRHAGSAQLTQLYPVAQVTGLQVFCDPPGTFATGVDADLVNLSGTDFGFTSSITGGTGSDTIFGQLGANDIITGQFSGRNLILGSLGNDNILSVGSYDTLRSGGGTDTIRANDGNNVLAGGKDGSVLFAGVGADTLRAGAGNSTLHGGDGGTLMIGGFGNDLLIGGSGNDTMIGGSGQEHLIGGPGDDYLDGGWDSYLILQGGATLPAASAGDTLDGSAGLFEDTLIANSGSPVLTGSAQMTTYAVNTPGAVFNNLRGGDFVAQNDTVASITSTTTVHLTIVVNQGGITRSVLIPMGAGNAPSGISAARTTDANGTVVFQNGPSSPRLRDFFWHWGVAFNNVGIGQFVASVNSGHTYSMTVNGAPSQEYGDYFVQNGDNIVIRFTQ